MGAQAIPVAARIKNGRHLTTTAKVCAEILELAERCEFKEPPPGWMSVAEIIPLVGWQEMASRKLLRKAVAAGKLKVLSCKSGRWRSDCFGPPNEIARWINENKRRAVPDGWVSLNMFAAMTNLSRSCAYARVKNGLDSGKLDSIICGRIKYYGPKRKKK